MLETHVTTERFDRDYASVIHHERHHVSFEGKIMLDMIIKWGMISAEPDGEDSQGRQQLKLMPEEMLVARASSVTQYALAELKQQGWIVEIPSMKELIKIKENANKKEMENA
jgi:hypothetical protein